MSSPTSEFDVAAEPRVGSDESVNIWQRFDSLLERAGDMLNPILVKEARQALKSKQFAITFVLVLAACWLWSIVQVALIGPRIYYSNDGPELFYAYYQILLFCLAIVIPFFTYRSMVSEREDNTYELLSITTLRPRQIVSGKLGSAAIQMMVYFSAVAPCLAFTYMLRGIDIVTVGLLLAYAILGSFGLAMIGLFFATLTPRRYVQVLLSVALVAGLIGIYCVSWEGTYELLRYSSRYIHDEDTWIGNAVILTIFITYFIQIFLSATALLTFTSENRSSALRWGMMLQHGCIVGWMGYVWFREGHHTEIAAVLMILLGIHWYVMGMLMLGESTAMSERVKRGLPQSFLGRVFLTWFNPGPATGFMFAVTNLIAGLVVCLFAMAAVSIWSTSGTTYLPWSVALTFAALLICYVTFFLGLGNLILFGLRRITHVTIVTSILVQLILLVVFCLVPMVLQSMSRTAFNGQYTLLQMTNVFWSLGMVVERSGRNTWQVAVLYLCVPMGAVIVWLANLPIIAAAVRHVRVEHPVRLIEEEAEIKAALAGPSSPWD